GELAESPTSDLVTVMHQCFENASRNLDSNLAFCAATSHIAAMQYDSPRRAAALLGRFLPRLGPFVQSSGPFFIWVRELFGRGAGDGKANDAGHEGADHGFEVASDPVEAGRFGEARLIHIEGAVDLDLERVLGLVR